MGNTGATEALQNSEQSLWVPTSHAAYRQQLLSPSLSLSCHPFFYLFSDFSLSLCCSSWHFFLSVTLLLSASLFFCLSVTLSPHCAPQPVSQPPSEDAVSAALADLDVMKLQVCQHHVCVCVRAKVRGNMLSINNFLVKMGSGEVNVRWMPVCVCMCNMDQSQFLSCLHI